MTAKLIKNDIGYHLWLNLETKEQEHIASDNPVIDNWGVDLRKYKLSKQNCDEIFGVVDVEKLCKQEAEKLHDKSKHEDWDVYNCLVYEDTEMIKIGFNKAMEFNKDKVFTLEDLRRAMNWIMTQYYEFYEQPTTGRREQYLQSLQQLTEIEVEIEMGDVIQLKKRAGGITNMGKPKLDSEGCLILKKI